jgi:hypothetical protein
MSIRCVRPITHKPERRIAMRSISYLRTKQPLVHRFGPDGQELDEAEAHNWFPRLDVSPTVPNSISVGCRAELRYRGMQFEVCNVQPSRRELGILFGDISGPGNYLRENDECLDVGQNIGFEPRHVFRVIGP